jgi:hypothetical protein
MCKLFEEVPGSLPRDVVLESLRQSEQQADERRQVIAEKERARQSRSIFAR